MLRWILLLATSACSAPFCVVTHFNRHCWYYDANECKRQADLENGLCESEGDKPSPAPSGMSPSLQSGLQGLGGIGDALEQYRLRKQQEEESKASVDLLHAQTEQTKADLRLKSAQFSADHPDQPNPYQDALDRLDPKPAPKQTIAQVTRANKGANLFLPIMLCAMVAAIGIVVIANN